MKRCQGLSAHAATETRKGAETLSTFPTSTMFGPSNCCHFSLICYLKVGGVKAWYSMQPLEVDWLWLNTDSLFHAQILKIPNWATEILASILEMYRAIACFNSATKNNEGCLWRQGEFLLTRLEHIFYQWEKRDGTQKKLLKQPSCTLNGLKTRWPKRPRDRKQTRVTKGHNKNLWRLMWKRYFDHIQNG